MTSSRTLMRWGPSRYCTVNALRLNTWPGMGLMVMQDMEGWHDGWHAYGHKADPTITYQLVQPKSNGPSTYVTIVVGTW